MNNDKPFLTKWPYLAGIIFTAGLSYASVQTQLLAKTDSTDVQRIAEREVKDHAYEKEAGIRLEEQFKAIEKSLEEIKEFLKEKLK